MVKATKKKKTSKKTVKRKTSKKTVKKVKVKKAKKTVKKKVAKKKTSKKTVKKKKAKKKAVKKKTIKKVKKKKAKKTVKKKVAKKKPVEKKEKKVRLKPPIKYLKVSEEKIKDFISELIGKEAVPVIEILLIKNNVSEFTIAEKLNLSINQFRNIIYRLDYHSLVSFIRKKDKQRGWYIYYWTLDPYKLEYVYWSQKQKKLERLENQVKEEETTHFYICPNKCDRVNLDKAMELEFRCPECGKLLEEDELKIIGKIKKEIENLKKELKEKTD